MAGNRICAADVKDSRQFRLPQEFHHESTRRDCVDWISLLEHRERDGFSGCPSLF